MTNQERIEALWERATEIEENGERYEGEYEEILQKIDALEASQQA
jgi:hypothetical protein